MSYNPRDYTPRAAMQKVPRGTFSLLFQWGCIAIVALALLSAGGWGLGYVAGWWGQANRIISPENVRQVWGFGYEMRQSLDATAVNACGAQKAYEQATTQEEKTARESQLLAYQQNYARIEQQYNAKFRNLLDGKIVKPPDLEYPAPTLAQDEVVVCPR
jgi:hypothetical protein